MVHLLSKHANVKKYNSASEFVFLVIYYRLLVAVRPWYWLEDSHYDNVPRPKVIKGARRSMPRPYHQRSYNIGSLIPLQATIHLFINWLLVLIMTPGFNRVILGFTRPVWILLGLYGSVIMGCASPVL